MKNKLRIALIPAYEPESLLLDLLCESQEAGMIAIVIDDGSGPSFSNIFEKSSSFAVVLTHPQNCGKGRAIKTGLHYIESHFSDDYTVVTMDSDGQHQVLDAIKICEQSELNPNFLILGSRQLKQNVPLRSQFGNTITRFVYSLSTKTHVHDTQTGLRAFNSKLLSTLLDINGERYEYEMNVLLEFARRQIPIKEIPISTIYVNNNAGSHFDTLKDSYRIYKNIIKFSASSVVSFLLDYSLYSLLIILSSGLGQSMSLSLSNIIARVISSCFNYTINRKMVFKSNKNVWKSAIQYFALAAIILVGNTLVLNLLVDYMEMNHLKAKLLTEILFFIFSWLTQRFLIFKKDEPIHTEINGSL